MAEYPAMPLWTDAYLGDTTHLNVTEHGAYFLLLITAWRTSDCSLPDDDRLLARYARCEARQWKKLRPIIEPFFVVEDGKWRQRRLTDEREAVERKREIAASNGRASALKRQGRHATSKTRSLREGNSHTPKTNAGENEPNSLENHNLPSTEREQSDSEARTERQRSENLTISNSKTPVSPLNEKPTKRALPGDWEPEEFGDGTECRSIVASWSPLDFERQLERFRAHHEREGNRYASWQAAWKTWVLNSVRFDRGKDRRDEPDKGDLVEAILAEHNREAPP